MNIFDRIEQDHARQRELTRALLDTSGDSDTRRKLFSEFVAEYRAHAAAEEHAFYAELLKDTETTEQSRHSVAEHQETMELLEKLEQTDMSSPGWAANFKKLADENEHHMEEEENDVFPLARNHMDDARIRDMLQVFEQRKADELA